MQVQPKSLSLHLRGAFSAALGGNAYNRSELAGAFGDLGTFIPFVVGYITVNKMDPVGILFAFGLFKVLSGLYFKTPISVQPMKAIGGAAIANPGAITSGMVWGSGVFTAVFWTVMAVTGAVDWIAKITARPVMWGIMLGLGLSFMLDGLASMGDQPIVAAIGLGISFLFLSNRRMPAMLLLLAFGIGIALVQNPGLLSELGHVSVRFRLPELTLQQMSWNDILLGTVILGVPQVPLTLGNAILGATAENNALFPHRPVEVKKVALHHGLMNFVSAAIGGVPLCHGAGGMAGHVRFGAKTGGALVIMGAVVAILALFFSDSVALLFRMIPTAILGVMLFIAGLELASNVQPIGRRKEDLYVLLATAGFATINLGLAFAVGIALHYAIQRKLVKPGPDLP